ncbi:MAG: EAL domain-containing protein [Alphaproteobacteria bacterium]|nr:EAL domain-containing protein [Alphaproteobacteria bacterium]
MINIVTKDAEAKLVEHCGKLRESATLWRALHFRFAQLLEHYKSDYQIKIATNLITDLLKDADGMLFLCPDCDIFVVAKSVNKSLLEKVIFQLRYLFIDDPLAYNANAQENADFCTLYDLSVDWQDYMNACKKKLSASAKNELAEALMAANDTTSAIGIAASRRIKPMTPTRLASVERDLRPADISRVIRKQPICAAQPGKKIRRVFDELYINISHLRQLIMADVDFTHNRPLFRYLTQVMDEKVLELLRRNTHRYFDMPVSLNLNVATLLSDKFADFDAAIKPSIKVSIVLELEVSDVFSDMEAFLMAKNAVQKMGYRVCLDGLTTNSFLHVNREKLGFDLAKLQWNADADSELDMPANRELAEAVARCGANRVILCRCDSRQAIDYGQAMGISLFQGRYLDKVINPNAKVEN